MALNESRKRTLKVVSATAMTIFSLLSVFMGTMAWFTSARVANNESDQFAVVKVEDSIQSITVHEFYGSTSDGSVYGFNPSKASSITWSGDSASANVSFSMGTFSLEDQHHPVLFLFELDGPMAAVRFKTEYPYLAKSKPGGDLTGTGRIYSTYAALEAASKTDGYYYEVTHDENQNAYYTENSVDYYVASRYIYHSSTNSLELVWVDLGEKDNPLSSIADTFWFLFTDDPTDSAGTYTTTTGNLMVDDGNGGKVSQSRTYVPLAASGFTTGNQSSFVTVQNDTPNYNPINVAYNGGTAGCTHLGIVLDYNADSLEYIYSYFLGHDYLNAIDGLGFKCDWILEV